MDAAGLIVVALAISIGGHARVIHPLFSGGVSWREPNTAVSMQT